MLYKKIHRQYLRQFRVGRKYRFAGFKKICKITKEPFIHKYDKRRIYIMIDRGGILSHSVILSLCSTSRLYDNIITWLD